MSAPIRPTATGEGIELALKVVPGASSTELVGLYGDRYRLRVAAPPEGGKANTCIVAFLAKRLQVRRRDVEIVAGHGSPLKTVRVHGISPTTASHLLS